MKGKDLKGKLFFVLCISLFFLTPAVLQAQNYGTQDSSKTDTSGNKTDTTGMHKDTTGYLDNTGMSTYALNINLNQTVLQDSSSSSGSYETDTTKTDTTKKDTVGYLNNTNSNEYAFNSKSSFLQDSTATDTSKGAGQYRNDTTKTDTSYKKNGSMGYLNKTDGNIYAYDGSLSLLNMSAARDSSDSTGTQKDTMGYNNSNKMDNNNNSGNMSNNNSGNMNNSYSSNSESYSSNQPARAVEVNPAQDLSQQLQEKVNLNQDQTKKVHSILLQYEADTYNANGDKEEAQEAASDAQNNIADVLTDTQKSEWNNTKNDWWTSVQKQLDLTNLSSKYRNQF